MRRTRLFRGIAGCTAAFLLLLAGCDVVDTGEQTFLEVSESFDFEFSADQLQAGQTVEITSDDLGDIGGQLGAFSKDEIVSARVTGVTLERLQPVGVDLNQVLTNATVQLQASGQNAVQVATLSSPPDDETAQLTVSNANVGTILARPSFQGALRFTPAASVPDGFYRLRATVEFEVTLEGL